MPICHNKQFERKYVLKKSGEGYLCMKIAGSGSAATSVCDVVALKDHACYLVEVKATKEEVFKPTKVVREQLETLRDAALRAGAIPLLAVKFKHGNWVEYNLEEGLPERVVR